MKDKNLDEILKNLIAQEDKLFDNLHTEDDYEELAQVQLAISRCLEQMTCSL